MAEKSRAEYFRERRKKFKAWTFLVDNEKAEMLDKKLEEQGRTRMDWFREKLDEEILSAK